ncbi:MAG: protein translocase subunit SecD, partial [Planctomycetales bacterium]
MQSSMLSLFAAAGETNMNPLLILAILVAVFAGPLLLAQPLGSALRMKDYAWKFYLIFWTLFAGSTAIYFNYPPRLGIDLGGGTNLIYGIDKSSLENPDQPIDWELIKATLRKRIDPGGVKDVTIQTFGDNQIEIIMPGTDQATANQIKESLQRVGSLEFLIVADPKYTHHADILDKAFDVKGKDVNVQIGRNDDGTPRKKTLARWHPVYVETSGVNKGDLRFNPLGYNTTQQRGRNWRRMPDEEVQVLLVFDKGKTLADFNSDYYRSRRVTGEDLSGYKARMTQDNSGLPAVGFKFGARGASKFGSLTGNNSPTAAKQQNQLAIVFDRHVHSAPTINSRIQEEGIITGIDVAEERETLINVLKSGALPAALSSTPMMEKQISSTMGVETQTRGKFAIGLSLVAVLIFMLVYYRVAGVIACLAVVGNLVLLLAIMMQVNAAFTLPGLAGVVLTVGMAVDANVLIFERIREEMDRGSTLRMAIRNGFSKATVTIVDANLTTLITATVLYLIGTDQVRGFAVTLWIGIVLSMFTSIFCARVAFDVLERKRWLTELSMMRLLQATNINFLSHRKTALFVSIGVILVGLTAVGFRGFQAARAGMLDIDFTGGITVWIQFPETQDESEVQDAVRARMPEATVTNTNTGESKTFKVTTQVPSQDAVFKQLDDDDD